MCSVEVKHVFIDTDCGTDDLIAIDLLLNSRNIEIIGVSCVHGLTEPKDGAQIIRRLLDYYGHINTPIYIGKSDSLGKTNFFPKSWKQQSTEVGYKVLNINSGNKRILEFDAINILNSFKANNQFLLTLGPLTNIENLIVNDRMGKLRSITTIIMGGAISVEGNLFDNEINETKNRFSEWNFYCDPLAAKICLSYLKNIILVPLDASNSIKIDKSYLVFSKWKNRKNKITYSILKNVENWIYDNLYFAWDPLAAAYLINPDVLILESSGIQVSIAKDDLGRTYLDETENKILYAKFGNKILFDNIIFNTSIL